MENRNVSKYTTSFGLALALCSVINALLVVMKEKSQTVVSVMQRITGHQWVTHSAFVIVLFALSGWSFAQANRGQGFILTTNRLIQIVVAGVVAGGLIIIGFYLIAD